MMKNKNQMKIKRVLYDDAYNFEKLSGFIKIFKNGVIEIDDSGLVHALEEAIKDQDENKRLHAEIKELEDKIKLQSEKLQVLQDESDELDELRVDIDRLQDEKTQLQQELKKNVELKQELEKELKEPNEEVEALAKELEEYKNVKTFFNTYGRYVSLRKEITVILYFLKFPRKSIRLIELKDHFKNELPESTLRKHVRSLIDRGLILKGDHYGEYRLNRGKVSDFKRDMYKVVRSIVGDDLFSMAVESYNERFQ